METIRLFAEDKDYSSIEKLWNECFSQFGNYSEFFMKNIYKKECARLLEVDGTLAGMIHVFPRKFLLNGEAFSAKYIFGVGTLKAFRGLGIAGKLLEEEKKDCDFLTLIPQDSGLFEFYKKKGFSVITSIKEETITEGEKCEVRPAGKKDIPCLDKMYREMCKNILFAERSEKDWETIIAEYEFLGGGFFIFDGGYLAYAPSEDVICIDEFCSSSLKPAQVSGVFEKPVTLRCPGEGKNIAVILPVSEKGKKLFSEKRECYINLMHN